MISGWNELLIAGFSHRSKDIKDALMLESGVTVYRQTAHQFGVVPIFERVLTELVSKMREMKMDKTELGCLRAIILFNSGDLPQILTNFFNYTTLRCYLSLSENLLYFN